MSFAKALFSFLSPAKRKPRVFIDAAAFDPDQPRRRGRAVILIAQNDEDNIYERVSRALLNSAGVVVLDYGSTDGTPYFAAEAGALVVIKEPHQAEEEAMAAAYRAAQRFSTYVEVGC